MVLTVMFILKSSFAYSLSVETHEYLNVEIANRTLNNFSLDNYLKFNLGLSGGINAIFNDKSALKWLEAGGRYEDLPAWYLQYLRSVNHFHNPSALSISQAGFSGIWDTHLLSGTSAILWSQSATGTQSPGGFYSWNDARSYFYNALISTVPETRNTNYADTFRGLGQLMHLVQDMSVPEHSRNDGHYGYAYEEWVAEPSNASVVNDALANPKYPDTTVLSRSSPFSQAPVSIANLFDTKQYDGSNPAATVGLTYGLSEYSNANFFTAETIFRNGFPYPAWSSVSEYDETDIITGKKRTYLRKVADGEQIEHAARGVRFFKYLPTAMKSSGFGLKLDKKVYADYAPLLLPRAVGYSAIMLNYFFRGTIDLAVTAPEDITFRSIKITVQNATPNEAMGTGEVSLVIRYKALAETDLGNGKFLLNNPAADYSYKVVKLLNVDLSSPRELTFDLSADPLPFNFSDMTMQLVYSGPLGNESGAVAVSKPEIIDGIYTDFDLSLPTSGVYAKTSDNSPTATFNELRLTALSDIPGGLSGGTITLALDYRTAIGNQFESAYVDTEPVNAAGYIFRAPARNGVNALPQGVSVELIFDLPQLPVAATDVEISIIYTKADGTQAIGYRDISEPTPVDVYNNTDYTCLNGVWYRYDDPTAMAIVDSNDDGIADRSDIYPHTISNISFLAGPAGSGTLDAGASSTLFSAGSLPTGQMLRLGYILTDYANRYAINETRTGQNGDPWPHAFISRTYPGTGFRNDSDSWSSMFTFRNTDTKMWWGTSVIFVNKEYPLGSSCAFDALNQKLGL